jgi:hypothetical protein
MRLTQLQAHSERVQKGSDRLLAQIFIVVSSHSNTAYSIASQLESAELELSDLRHQHELSLAAVRECEAKVASEMMSKLDLMLHASGG